MHANAASVCGNLVVFGGDFFRGIVIYLSCTALDVNKSKVIRTLNTESAGAAGRFARRASLPTAQAVLLRENARSLR